MAKATAVPRLICDRYDRWLVVQLMSAGIEHYRDAIVAALESLRQAVRHPRPQRRAAARERATPGGVELLAGDVPREIEVNEHGVRYLAAPWDGQKTGAFLDQRENVSHRRRARGERSTASATTVVRPPSRGARRTA